MNTKNLVCQALSCFVRTAPEGCAAGMARSRSSGRFYGEENIQLRLDGLMSG
jgi:hypothetical protein